MDNENNSNSFIIEANGEKLEVSFMLCSKNMSIFLKRSMVESFRIEQDIYNIFSKCYVKIKDTGNYFALDMKADGESWAHVSITQLSDATTFQDVFIVNYSPIISYDVNSCTLELELVSFKSLNLYNRLLYSNYNKSPEDAIDIILYLLKNSKNPSLKLKSFTNVGNKSFNELIVAKTDNIDYVLSGFKLQYITDRNSLIKDHIDYLLTLANSKVNGFYFIFYNPFENKYIISNTKSKYNEEDDPDYFIGVNSPQAMKKGHYTASNVKTFLRSNIQANEWNNASNSLTKLEETYKNSQVIGFDLKKNTYTKLNIKKAEINKLFNNIANGEFILPNSRESTTFTTGYREPEIWKFQNNIKDIYLKYEEVEFVVPGVLKRLPGNFLNVDFKMLNVDRRLNGKWFIKTISNQFSNGKYEQHLICCRCENEKLKKLESIEDI